MALDKDNKNINSKAAPSRDKVQQQLVDIRRQADALIQENRRLKEQLKELRQRKEQIGDSLVSAHATARSIVSQARREADKILSEAREERACLLAQAAYQQEKAARCVGQVMEQLRRQQAENIKTIDRQWQDFLCGLNELDGSAPKPGFKPEEARKDLISPQPPLVPQEELEHMVNNIAKELWEIMDKQEGEG